MFSPESDLALALELADAADQISLARFRALDLKIEQKPDLSPVTDADKTVELEITAILEKQRPDDAVVGEEFGSKGQSNRKWILDPIDGTANFVRGVPIWASLICLSIAGEPSISVVSAPAMGLRWWAAPGVGSYARSFDGTVRKLSVSSISKVSDCSVSYNSLQYWQKSEYFPQLLELSKQVWRTRAFGDFWSYMLLAEGAIDVVTEHDLKIYDIAALVPIVKNAGGEFSALLGPLSEQSSSVLATNSLLHEKIQNHFRSAN